MGEGVRSALQSIYAQQAASWGGHCAKCGHPASYHGMTFCQVEAGASTKRQCDCDGYETQRVSSNG